MDEQTYAGNLLTQPDAALAFISRNTQQRIHITGRAERETIPEYPEAAVREAVINAICHRDYTQTGTVQIRIYDDRLEVWNPGMLPPDLTVEALYKEHPSRPRYPRIATALHHADIIEHWGTGTLRIVDACREHGLPRPAFSSDMGVFIVRFETGATYQPSSEVRSIAARQAYTVEYIERAGEITTSQYQTLFNLSERQALRDLSMLVEQGVLHRIGRGRATHYRLATASTAEESRTLPLFDIEDDEDQILPTKP